MIILPSGLPTSDVWKVTNNAYKCVDAATMLSQSDEDCHLYVQRLFWERPPESECFAPNFALPIDSILLIREDLTGPDMTARPSGNRIPFIIRNHGGYTTGEEIALPRINITSWTASPVLLPTIWRNPDSTGGDVPGRWLLMRPYFPPHKVSLRGLESSLEPLDHFNVISATALRFQFGSRRQIHGILFYRPHFGRHNHFSHDTWTSHSTIEHGVQVLILPGESETYTKVFDNLTSTDYSEPEEELCRPWWDQEYRGGIPCVANVDSPVQAREVFVRWSGHMTHIQLLDSPIIRPSAWELADFPGMTFSWGFKANRILRDNPQILTEIPNLTEADLGKTEFDFIGNLSTGIRFKHPLGRGIEEEEYLNYDFFNETSRRNPYHRIDYYTALCLNFFDDEDDHRTMGDTWELQSFATNFNARRYNPNFSIRTDGEGNSQQFFATRDVDDNQFYAANRALLKWYYAPETNSWKSNHTRPSTDDQLRILVTLPEVQVVCGCINPMSVPATANKPIFRTVNNEIRFHPGLYENYIVPWRVLIEGRANNHARTQWELMDEFALEHCSARAFTYFSYPRPVRFIRITIQDWYGNSLLDDMRDDYLYRDDARRGHYDGFSAVAPPASEVIRWQTGDNLGTLLEMPNHDGLRAEWNFWKERTIQSIWKAIYIPPFLFFGDNGER